MQPQKQRTLASMQQELDEYISQFKLGYFPPMEQLARMSEEVGELAREISHTFGNKKKKETEEISSIEEELADVLIVTLLLANSLDIDLTEQFKKNMKKFWARDSHRFERRS